MEELVKQSLETLEFEENLIQEIMQSGRLRKIKEGHGLIDPKMQPSEIPLVLEGI